MEKLYDRHAKHFMYISNTIKECLGALECANKIATAVTQMQEEPDLMTYAGMMKLVSESFLPLVGVHFIKQGCSRVNFKDVTKAVCYRDYGDLHFHQNHMAVACSMYSLSIATMPSSSPEISLSYANRSVVLRSLGRHRECMEDLKRASESGYPECLRYKLMIREAQCLRDLGEQDKASETFDRTAQYIEKSPELAAIKKELLAIVETEKRAPKLKYPTPEVVMRENCIIPSLADGHDYFIPSASKAIELSYDGVNNKWHFVAHRDLQIGEVVIVEEPFTSTLLSHQRYRYCTHCMKKCYSLLPCQNCCWAMFCSLECQALASNYHPLECGIIERLHLMEPDLEPESFALYVRTIAKAGFKNVQDYLKEEANLRFGTPGFNSDDFYIHNSLKALCNLQCKLGKRDLRASINTCILTLEVVYCFRAAGYEVEDKMAGLFLRLQDSMKTNSACYMDTEIHNDCLDLEMKLVEIGKSISGTYSFLTHSCAPNLMLYRCNNVLVLRTSEPVEEGSPLTMSFCKSFSYCPKEKRKSYLSQAFCIDCKCDACEGDWPLYKKLPTTLGLNDTSTFLNMCQMIGKEYDRSVIMRRAEEFATKLAKDKKKAHARFYDAKNVCMVGYRHTGDHVRVYSPVE